MAVRPPDSGPVTMRVPHELVCLGALAQPLPVLAGCAQGELGGSPQRAVVVRCGRFPPPP
eukprot:scaffold2520_cov324-Prasinococcus_capsulatus_cf.AAC.4